jgi:two-component system nitrate/nitrite response regulator NarL
MTKSKIFIVDDHQIMVDGIKSLLEINNNYEIVGTTTKSKEALNGIINTNANLVITDINMDELSGIELTKRIKAHNFEIKVLALSMYSDKATINEMIEAGVDGYILKNTGLDELTNAIKTIEMGNVFFSNQVTLEMLKSIKEVNSPIETNEFEHLTPREIQIIKLIAEEMSNAEIGDKLFISERTVETHRKNIFRKTNIKSVAGLIKYAITHKII